MSVPNDQHGCLASRLQLVFLATNVRVNLTTDSIPKVNLAVEHVLECRGRRIWITSRLLREPKDKANGSGLTLEVSHEGLRARVERVDDHFAVGRTGNLNSTILQAWGGGCANPCGVRSDCRSF
jgi:hypothetical protein